MEKTKCERCGVVDFIPTYQFVKFDDKINYLCKNCWEHFLQWFNVAMAEKKSAAGKTANLAQCARCGGSGDIPNNQHIKFNLRLHHVCKACWDRFRKMILKETGSGEEGVSP